MLKHIYIKLRKYIYIYAIAQIYIYIFTYILYLIYIYIYIYSIFNIYIFLFPKEKIKLFQNFKTISNYFIQNILIKQLVNLYCHNCSINIFFQVDI